MKICKIEDILDYQMQSPGALEDVELKLVLKKSYSASIEHNLVPGYDFDIYLKAANCVIGSIRFRVALNDWLAKLGGHIGYEINEAYRGHHYAAKSCKLLFPFISDHGLNEVLITCDPQNIASKRTCEIIGGKLKEIKNIEIEPNVFRDTCYFIVPIK